MDSPVPAALRFYDDAWHTRSKHAWEKMGKLSGTRLVKTAFKMAVLAMVLAGLETQSIKPLEMGKGSAQNMAVLRGWNFPKHNVFPASIIARAKIYY